MGFGGAEVRIDVLTLLTVLNPYAWHRNYAPTLIGLSWRPHPRTSERPFERPLAGRATPKPAATTQAGDGDGETADDATDPKDAKDKAEEVTGAAAAKAKAAALKAVPGGTVDEVHAETQDATDAADTPEPGDTPDPAYERKIAYDVDVTKAGGSEVTVHLDKRFAVLGTEVDQHDGGADQGD